MTKIMATSVSALEGFRRFQDELLEESELIERITTPFSVASNNPRIQRGIDLHKYIETGDIRSFSTPWDIESVDNALTVNDSMGSPEMWISGSIGDIYIYAKADLIYGNEIRDFKATGVAFDVDSYAASYQWRLYLTLSGCDKFIYRIFELSESVPTKVFRNHHFPLYRYPAMKADCENLIREYVSWAETVPAIVERQRKPTLRRDDFLTA